MRPIYYILEDGEPKPVADVLDWAKWFENAFPNPRVVQQDYLKIPGMKRKVKVSTIFLGVDHNFHFKGPPVLFETMIFGGPLDQEQERYCTRKEALAGHARWIARVSGAGKTAST